MTMIFFILGLGALVLGAEMLVRGASRLAAAVRISSLVIGLTVVAFGTSFPELAVSVQSAFLGQADIALGNVVGSNIFNVLLILGISALIVPLRVSHQLVRFDVPIMIGVSILLFMMSLDGKIGRADGIILFSGIVAYTAWLFRKGSKTVEEPGSVQAAGSTKDVTIYYFILQIVLLLSGLVLLVIGSRWLVQSAIVIAHTLGLSELVVGLTIVAAGTSLPEVATSIVASIRRERDIAVGNVVGSNIFNILSVLGVSASIAPDGIRVAPSALHFDIPVMVAAAVVCLPVFFTGRIIARWEGALFLGYYGAYTLYLIMASSHHNALPVFNSVMMMFVIPLTVLVLGGSLLQSFRGQSGDG
ncbi:calcium/sodium antiporter [bacterium]|nr:calcium/sodium antiporter [bacterium]